MSRPLYEGAALQEIYHLQEFWCPIARQQVSACKEWSAFDKIQWTYLLKIGILFVLLQRALHVSALRTRSSNPGRGHA